jgi:lipopolysaccharide/colanic/teichoic acid biosynthesis glycosyltransferase
MRKTGIDEFPQMVNILLGDMNLFWYRAITPSQFEQFNELERKRYASAKPWLIGAYLFYGQWGSTDKNPRKANDAYMRLRKMKERNRKELILMNLEALRRSLMAILEGKHT